MYRIHQRSLLRRFFINKLENKTVHPEDSSERAVTSVIGNVLLVAIVVVLGAVVTIFALGLLDGVQEPSPDVVIDATTTDGEIRLVHQAGPDLQGSNLDVVVETQNGTKRVPFSQGSLTGGDGSLSAGDRWRYCQVAAPGSAVETTLVHKPSQSVLARIEQSAAETEKTELEYRCGSAVRRSGRGGGWATFSMQNFASEPVRVTAVTVTSDSEATRLDGLNESGTDHAEVYIDADGDEVYNYPSEDAYAYRAGPADYDIGQPPEKIDVQSLGTPNDYAVIQPGATPHFSLYQFQDSADNFADIRSAELTVTLYFVDRPSRTYSIILPQTRSG